MNSDNTAYVVQFYYDQDNQLLDKKTIAITDGFAKNPDELGCNEIKQFIQRDGLWPHFARRIKNLEKAEKEFWSLYNAESDYSKKRQILEDIVNMQSIISNCYAGVGDILNPKEIGK